MILYHTKAHPRKYFAGVNNFLNLAGFLDWVSYTVIPSRAKGGKNVSKGNPHICVRLDEKTLSEIRMQAEAVGETVSGFVRQIIYAWLEEHS